MTFERVCCGFISEFLKELSVDFQCSSGCNPGDVRRIVGNKNSYGKMAFLWALAVCREGADLGFSWHYFQVRFCGFSRFCGCTGRRNKSALVPGSGSGRIAAQSIFCIFVHQYAVRADDDAFPPVDGQPDRKEKHGLEQFAESLADIDMVLVAGSYGDVQSSEPLAGHARSDMGSCFGNHFGILCESQDGSGKLANRRYIYRCQSQTTGFLRNGFYPDDDEFLKYRIPD